MTKWYERFKIHLKEKEIVLGKEKSDNFLKWQDELEKMMEEQKEKVKEKMKKEEEKKSKEEIIHREELSRYKEQDIRSCQYQDPSYQSYRDIWKGSVCSDSDDDFASKKKTWRSRHKDQDIYIICLSN